MKSTMLCPFVLAALAASSGALAANAPAFVDSKEYKVLLDPARFAGNPQSAANQLLLDLSSRLNALGFDKTLTGSFSAGDVDTVTYYDTAGSCALQANGYSLRTRSGDHQDIQFKFRHADEELAAATDVSGKGKNPSTKLETDVSPDSLVYSHSTKQDPASGGTPATVGALASQFPGAGALSAYNGQALVAVNGLSVRQQEFEGPGADLGKSQAEFTLSLWYLGNAGTPALAELSFRVEANDDAYYTTPVLQRSQTLLKGIGSLDGWVLSPRSSKTRWLYGYHSAAYPNGFCNG